MLAGIGRMTARRRLRVLAAWAVLVVSGVVLGGSVFDHATPVDDAPTGSESMLTQERLDELAPEGPMITAVITGEDFFAPHLVDSASAVVEQIRGVPGVVEVVDAYTSGGLIGDDGRSSLVTVELSRDLTEDRALAAADTVGSLLHTIRAPEVLVGGELLSERAFADRAIQDAAVGEGIALVVLLVVLIAVLGGFRVGILPVVAALSTISVALLVLAAIVGAVQVNEFAVNVVTLLGLGLAVDYSLLVIARFRDERELDPLASIEDLMARTVESAGRAVLVSGLAVSVALAGMLLLGDPLLSGMAIGGVIVVLIATVAGLTLVPASIAGIHRHLPARGARTWVRPWARGAGVRTPGLLGRLARSAQRRPVAVAVAATAGLLVLAAPIGALSLGSSEIRSLPTDTEERRAYEAATTGFTDLGVEPVTVFIDASIDDRGVTQFLDEIAALPQVVDAMAVPDLPAEVTAVDFTPMGDPTGAEAQRLVREIRDLPTDLEVGVAGPAAEVVDTRAHLVQRAPLAIGVVFLATFALLFALTRSVVVPLKALALTALTIAATLGILVAVFQWGVGQTILGFEPWGALDVTTPLLICLLAFGLAMDYQVFLLAQIHEYWRRRDPTVDLRTANDRAVLGGITATGPVVTTAGAAIVIIFLGFAVSDLLAMKEVGVGMAIAVLIDVTIVRGLLLPATMTLLGRWNWWRPGLRHPELLDAREPAEVPGPVTGIARTR